MFSHLSLADQAVLLPFLLGGMIAILSGIAAITIWIMVEIKMRRLFPEL